MSDRLAECLRGVPASGIVAVSGFGGAGKSTVAGEIGRRLGAPVVGADEFIKDRELADYGCWNLIDFARLEREVLAPFAAGADEVSYGVFDWASNRVASHRTLPGSPRLVVEGVGLFRRELRRYFAFALWVGCSLEEATRRGKKRDREIYGQPHDAWWDGLWRANDEECYRLYQPEQFADAIYHNASLLLPAPARG